MFEKIAAFIKNTFVYEEESLAETPKVADTSSAHTERNNVAEDQIHTSAGQESRSRSSSSSSGSMISPGDLFSSPRQRASSSEPSYSTDPQAAAQKQADNFSALRPKPQDTHYRMIIDQVFYAKGQGVVVRGAIGVGIARSGADSLIVHAANRTTLKTKVVAIERDGKVVNSAPTGCTVGLLLDGITRNDVHPGDVIGEI